MKAERVIVRGMRERRTGLVEEYAERGLQLHLINCTSKAKEPLWRQLSPFFAGPALVHPQADGDGVLARNVENAYQFSKLYKKHAVLPEVRPSEAWWSWARAGWASERAQRFPMGRGAAPLCSWHRGRAVGYVESRFVVYGPAYAEAVRGTEALAKLREMLDEPTTVLCLLDHDGYDRNRFGLSLAETIYNSGRKWGHSFALNMMLVEEEAWLEPYDASKEFSTKKRKGKRKGKAKRKAEGAPSAAKPRSGKASKRV